MIHRACLCLRMHLCAGKCIIPFLRTLFKSLIRLLYPCACECTTAEFIIRVTTRFCFLHMSALAFEEISCGKPYTDLRMCSYQHNTIYSHNETVWSTLNLPHTLTARFNATTTLNSSIFIRKTTTTTTAGTNSTKRIHRTYGTGSVK